MTSMFFTFIWEALQDILWDGEFGCCKFVYKGTYWWETVVQEKLAADPRQEERPCIPIDTLMDMLTICVKTTYFGIASDIYRQEEWLAMGLPLSPLLANINMEYFEEMSLGSTSLKPPCGLDMLMTHSFSGLIMKIFRHYLMTWTQSDHLYSCRWRKSKITNYSSSMY